MTDTERLAFILRVLKLTAEDDCGLRWADDGEFFINCNDLFWWGTADAEDVTPDNISLLADSLADCERVLPESGPIYAGELFACRVRRMRPQGCAYPRHKELWPLFDACGPERTDEHTERPA